MRNDLGKYKSTDALMMTITKNYCLDRLKTKKNKAVTLNPELNNKPDDDPLEIAERSDIVGKVKKFIQQLPEQQKTIVHLRDVEGCNFEEISKITGFELNYVRVNLSRGRKKVRESIQKLQTYEAERY